MADNQQDKAKQDKPKLIIDDDWKSQAQAEKEKLAEQIEGGPGGEPAGPGEAAGPGEPHELPPASFITLVSSIMTQAFFSLGGMEDPQTKRRYVDLELAKHHIDTLGVLEAKTKGNLTDEEKKALDRAIYQTRMQFVQMAQHLSSQAGGRA